MKIDQTRLFEFVGILAVVLSLMFLAWELNQSNRIAIASAETELRGANRDLRMQIAGNSELASLINKLKQVNPELSPVEETQVLNYARAEYNIYGAANQAYLNGVLTERSLSLFRTNLVALLNEKPGLVEYFAERAKTFNYAYGESPMWDTLLNELSKRGY